MWNEGQTCKDRRSRIRRETTTTIIYKTPTICDDSTRIFPPIDDETWCHSQRKRRSLATNYISKRNSSVRYRAGSDIIHSSPQPEEQPRKSSATQRWDYRAEAAEKIPGVHISHVVSCCCCCCCCIGRLSSSTVSTVTFGRAPSQQLPGPSLTKRKTSFHLLTRSARNYLKVNRKTTFSLHSSFICIFWYYMTLKTLIS